MDDGHCGLPTGELVRMAERLLEIQARFIEEALALELEAGEVVATR
jgi:exodeoxyribonuclease V alpha subunit